MKKAFEKYSALALCFGTAVYLAGTLTASASTPTITTWRDGFSQGAITYSPGQDDFTMGSDGLQTLSQPYEQTGIWSPNGTTDFTVQELKYDVDPIVYNNILMVNNSGVSQSYIVLISLPALVNAPTQIRGSIDTSVIGPNATVSSTGLSPIYTALIDGNPVHTLQNAPYSLFTPQPAVSDSDSYGWLDPYPGVANNIAIELRFTLTPGAMATIISDFEVVEVIPEPATLSLLGLGLLTLVMARKRS